MKKQDPKVALLRTVPSLAGQPDKELAQMAPFVDEASVETGFVLMREGTTGREAFLVVEGRADVSIAGRSVAQVGPGELLGEMALLDHSPRSATVTALTPMKLLVMDPGSFASIARQPTAGWRMAADLAARLRRVEGAPTYDARHRTAGGGR
ncbi:MAG: Crp/Fnr family transcriptional regulator [Microthrixaceae bacterium]